MNIRGRLHLEFSTHHGDFCGRFRMPISREITKEEKEHDRVAGDYASEKKISLLTVMEKKQKKSMR